MTSGTRVILKGELHSSAADLEEEKELLADGVDALVLEQSQSSSSASRLGDGWFFVCIASLTWILESLYHPKQVLVDLASAQGADVAFTRRDDLVPLENASTTMKAISAALFYTLVPGSIWIGFVTSSHLAGSLLLFLGLVLPVLVVRIYNTNRPDAERNRDQLIAETIRSAAESNDVVLAVVGAGHLPEVARRLPEDVAREIRPPVYDVWSIRHLKNVGLPTLKAGFVLFSLYVLCVWVAVQIVTYLSPFVIGALT